MPVIFEISVLSTGSLLRSPSCGGITVVPLRWLQHWELDAPCRGGTPSPPCPATSPHSTLERSPVLTWWWPGSRWEVESSVSGVSVPVCLRARCQVERRRTRPGRSFLPIRVRFALLVILQRRSSQVGALNLETLNWW